MSVTPKKMRPKVGDAQIRWHSKYLSPKVGDAQNGLGQMFCDFQIYVWLKQVTLKVEDV